MPARRRQKKGCDTLVFAAWLLTGQDLYLSRSLSPSRHESGCPGLNPCVEGRENWSLLTPGPTSLNWMGR